MILVTGATGSNGTKLLKLLTARNVPVRAMVRSPEKAGHLAALPGVELCGGDFDDPASLERALQGMQRAFLLTNSTERAEDQQRAFVAAARRTGLQHIVKLSQFAADEGSPVRFLRYHAAVERAVVESGIPYTFIRPNLFMQGLLSLSHTIRTQGRFFAAAGDAAVSVVDVRDNAAVAAAAFDRGRARGPDVHPDRSGCVDARADGRRPGRGFGPCDRVRRRAARGHAGRVARHGCSALAGGRAD